VADLNGDGYADIVVENSSGSLAYANMAGGVFNNWVGLPGTPGFTVVGGGDIAGTADADFVVEDSAGTIAYANMVNGQFSNWVGVATVPGWSVIAVEDVMGNGYDDIVIQNATTGQIAYADMTGGTFQGWVGVGSAPGFTGHTGPAAQAAAASAIFDPGPAATSQPNATTTTALADILTAGRLSGVP